MSDYLLCRIPQFLPRVGLTAILLSPTIAQAQPQALTVERAIELALETPRTLARKEALRQFHADVQTASLLPNPSVVGEVGLLPLSRRYTVDQPGGPTEIALGVSYPLDWLLFGKRAAAIGSANAAVGVAEADYADFVRRQVTDTAIAFYGVLEADALLHLAQEAETDLEQIEAAVAKAVANGGHPKIELSRVRLELQSVRRETRAAEVALSTSRAALASLVGKAGEEVPQVVQGTLDAPLGKKPLDSNTAFAIAKAHRPDILLLRRQSAKAKSDETFEERQGFPEATLGLGIVHQFQESLGAPDVTAWGASLEVSLPIFDRNQGNRTRAASVTQQTGYELTAALIDLRAQIEQAGHALAMAEATAAATASTDLELATYVRSSTKDAYAAGGLSHVELLDAQRAYREAQRATVISRADYLRALVQYESVLGKRIHP